MANLVQVEANAILNSSIKGTSYTAATLPVKLRLMTTNGTATSAGTEVTGGSYAAQDTTTSSVWGSASAGSITNSAGAVTFTGMPDTSGVGGVKGIELWDSAGTPVRRWFGALTATKTTGAGDTLTFPTSSITATLS